MRAIGERLQTHAARRSESVQRRQSAQD
jgi:hypothetical protein